eukprot:4490031-Ditylum_brightwellii.AAC.1
MLLMANFCKHYKRSNVEKGSGFNPPAILFIPEATMLNADNGQEFNLCLAIVIKNKPIKNAKSKFDLVKAIPKGNVLTHWQEFKHVKIVQTPKNLDGTDSVAPGICMDTYK